MRRYDIYEKTLEKTDEKFQSAYVEAVSLAKKIVVRRTNMSYGQEIIRKYTYLQKWSRNTVP